MAVLKPFAALRPNPELAERICELPYDVMSSEEARQMAAGNPLSFLHVSKPEIDLPPSADPHAPEVYATGKRNFDQLIAQGALRQDSEPRFYFYRQVMGGHGQTGLVAVAGCEDYLRGVIKKHELTRPDKEDDRVRHIETLNAQTGPVFLTYPAVAAIDDFVAEKTAQPPEVDFTAKDGVRHTAWSIKETQSIEFLEKQFAAVPFLYIADGHHRSAAAARVYRKRRDRASAPGQIEGGAPAGSDKSSHFLSVIFPHNQLRILPYNRVMKDLNGLSPEQLLEKLEGVFNLQPSAAPQSGGKHKLALFLRGQWYSLSFRPHLTQTNDPIEQLDVTLLQKHVLAPLFGIADPRTSNRIHFVGGIRGTAELEKLVGGGDYACAFSLFPTGIEDLMAIADAGGIMPPKSTWFEPKLRDAMFCHLI